jgi:hypothetical protein
MICIRHSLPKWQISWSQEVHPNVMDHITHGMCLSTYQYVLKMYIFYKYSPIKLKLYVTLHCILQFCYTFLVCLYLQCTCLCYHVLFLLSFSLYYNIIHVTDIKCSCWPCNQQWNVSVKENVWMDEWMFVAWFLPLIIVIMLHSNNYYCIELP